MTEDKRPCPDCDGEGEYSFPEASSCDMSDGWYKCERCNGAGYIPMDGLVTPSIHVGAVIIVEPNVAESIEKS